MLNSSSSFHRAVARAFLPFFVFAALVVPQRAYAVLPALAFAEVIGTAVESFVIRSVAKQVISTVGTAANDATWASNFSTWLAAARVVGSLVFNVSGYQGASQPITQIEVQVADTASADMTAGAVGTVYSVLNWTSMPGSLSADGLAHTRPAMTGYTTTADAVAAFVPWWNGRASANYQISIGPFYTCAQGLCADMTYAVGTVTYLSLTQAQQEAADGIGRVIGGPGMWYADSSDPDWSAAQKTAINGVEALRFRGVAATGQQAVIDLVPEASALRVRYVETVTYSYVRERNALTDNSFAPVAYDEANYQGVIEAAPTSTASSTTGTSVVFPTDYARQGEAAAAAQSINAKLDAVTGGFVATSGVDMSGTLDARIAAVSGVAASVPTVDWMPSLLPGTGAVACVPIPIDGNITSGLLNGLTASTTLDICDKLDLLRQFFGYLFMIGASVYIFRVFTRSNSTAGG